MILKLLLGFLIFLSAIYAGSEAELRKDIKPSFTLHSTGFVSDFVVDGNYLYASNDRGSIDIFDLYTHKIVHQVVLEPSLASDGEIVHTRIFSVDFFQGKLVFVSDGLDGYRDVWMYENYELKKIADAKDKLMVKEARFTNDGKIIFATYDSDMILYDSKEDFRVYERHVSQSFLGDITFNEDKSKIIMSDESGEIKILNLEDSVLEEELKSENVDNVFHVAISNGTILTAGQDRRIGVYQKGKPAYHLKSDFLVFCVGLSPSANIGIYSSGNENHLQLFNIHTKQKLARLVGHKSIINQIKFVNENELFSSERGSDILFWKLDKK